MGSSSGLAGLKCLQWAFRAIQFGCSIIILAIFSYYIATLSGAGMEMRDGVKAVEGITAISTIYTGLGLLLICCCAGHPAPSFISLVFDLCLAASFIYVAVENRSGSGGCNTEIVYTVYGSGSPGDTPGGGNNGMTTIGGVTAGGPSRLPTYRLACQLELTCLILASCVIPFFLLSVLLEIHINRKRYRNSRPIRDADGEYITKSDGQNHGLPPQRRQGLKGLRGFTWRGANHHHAGNPDTLPAHTQAGESYSRQVEVSPPEYGDVSSIKDEDRLAFNDGPAPGVPVMKSTTAPRPAADEYTEGDVGDRTYGLYDEDKHGRDGSEMGKTKMHGHDTKAARMERYVNT